MHFVSSPTMSVGTIDFHLSSDTDMTQNKNKINLHKHHSCLNDSKATCMVDPATPKLYFKDVVMLFIDDPPIRLTCVLTSVLASNLFS